MFKSTHAALMATTALMMSPAWGQAAFDDGEDDGGDTIVVTGVAAQANKTSTSISISTVDPRDAFKTAPRSLGELYRSIPGIRSEPATGAGNGSIAVRGIPLATGGYKYVQLQEDGLPVLQFGDIVAGNVPNYVRGDFTLRRIESVRGGSASTLTSYAPGGIINHLSKTGEDSEGGSIGFSTGLDYEEYRADFDYGGEIANDLFFHVGGFYRVGEGPREVGYNANDGGQIKFNITKRFDDGYLRLYYKHLDDNIATYTRAPTLANNGSYRPIPGFDGRDQAVSSAFRVNVPKLDHLGNPIDRRVGDHITARVDALGLEFSKDLGDGWSVINRFRTSEVRGDFNAPLALNFGEAGTLAADGFWACGCTPELSYANGPNVGQAVGPETLALGILELDFDMDDLGLTVNDLRVSKAFDGLVVTGGLYLSSQNIRQTWNNWEYYIVEALGDNAAGIAITDTATGEVVSGAGGVSGNAFLANNVDLNYETVAPYIDATWELDDLTLNASFRRDMTEVTGALAKAGKFFGAGVVSRDLNGDGDTTDVLDTVAIAQEGVTELAITPNYDREFNSYSFGANYQFAPRMAVFGRYSRGGVLVADRLWDGSNLNENRILAANTGLLEGIDVVKQAEVGYKFNGPIFDFFATAFWTESDETQSEITTQRVFTQTYEAYGLELEANARWGDFAVNGNLTWTDAEIIAADNPAIIGNQPNRQADYIFTLVPEYNFERVTVGAAFVGSSEFFHGDTETIRQDGYVLTHLFANFEVTEDVTLGLNVNNLTDEFINSFSESGIFASPIGDANLAETLNGRTINFSLRYDF
ncbi:MAG: TonB-dependent receptor [Parvularculaceae bacterium]|nr:TonB-dependent receptor [Parvularculaceae bacterium]